MGLRGCGRREDSLVCPLQATHPAEWWWTSQSERRERPVSQVKQVGRDNKLFILLLFCSDPQWVGWRPPASGRAVCFTLSANSGVHLTQKHPPRHTQKWRLLNIWWPCDPGTLEEPSYLLYIRKFVPSDPPNGKCCYCTHLAGEKIQANGLDALETLPGAKMELEFQPRSARPPAVSLTAAGGPVGQQRAGEPQRVQMQK